MSEKEKEKSLGDIIPKETTEYKPKDQYIKVKYGTFEFEGDIGWFNGVVEKLIGTEATIVLPEEEEIEWGYR